MAKVLLGLSSGALVWVFQRTAMTVHESYGWIVSCSVIGLIVGDLLRRRFVFEEPPAQGRGRVGFRTHEWNGYDGRSSHAGGQRGTEAFRNE